MFWQGLSSSTLFLQDCLGLPILLLPIAATIFIHLSSALPYHINLFQDHIVSSSILAASIFSWLFYLSFTFMSPTCMSWYAKLLFVRIFCFFFWCFCSRLHYVVVSWWSGLYHSTPYFLLYFSILRYIKCSIWIYLSLLLTFNVLFNFQVFNVTTWCLLHLHSHFVLHFVVKASSQFIAFKALSWLLGWIPS